MQFSQQFCPRLYLRISSRLVWRWSWNDREHACILKTICFRFLKITSYSLACSAGVFWAGESCLFMFVVLYPPSLMLWRRKIRESKIVTLRVGARAKGGKGGGRGEKKLLRFLFSLPAPFSPFFSSSNMARSRATSGARRKRLYCRLVTHRPTSSLLACVIKSFQCLKNFFMPFFFFCPILLFPFFSQDGVVFTYDRIKTTCAGKCGKSGYAEI